MRSEQRRCRGLTLVESLLVLGLFSLLITVFSPLLMRAMRTMFHVVGKADLQSGMRLALERIVRDVHQSQTVLEVASGTVTLFKPERSVVTTPEALVELNRREPGGLPLFPDYGTPDGQPTDADAQVATPGVRIVYRLEPARPDRPGRIVRSNQPGRLVGKVRAVPSVRQAVVTTRDFVPDAASTIREETLASDVTLLRFVPVAYGAEGYPGVAAGPPTSASALVIYLKGSSVVEGDRPDKPVVEELMTKAWLRGKLSQTLHAGAASALDDRADY